MTRGLDTPNDDAADLSPPSTKKKKKMRRDCERNCEYRFVYDRTLRRARERKARNDARRGGRRTLLPPRASTALLLFVFPLAALAAWVCVVF